MTIDDSFNEIIASNYFDTNTANAVLLTVSHISVSNAGLQIPGNTFQYHSVAGVTGILFVAGSSSNEPSGVTLTSNYYNGYSNASTGGGYGVEFNDAELRNLYLGGENFRLLSSALDVGSLGHRPF